MSLCLAGRYIVKIITYSMEVLWIVNKVPVPVFLRVSASQSLLFPVGLFLRLSEV